MKYLYFWETKNVSLYQFNKISFKRWKSLCHLGPFRNNHYVCIIFLGIVPDEFTLRQVLQLEVQVMSKSILPVKTGSFLNGLVFSSYLFLIHPGRGITFDSQIFYVSTSEIGKLSQSVRQPWMMSLGIILLIGLHQLYTLSMSMSATLRIAIVFCWLLRQLELGTIGSTMPVPEHNENSTLHIAEAPACPLSQINTTHRV